MSALGKHPREDEPAAPDAVAVADDESSDDEGPMPMPADARATQVKKRRVVAHEKVYLNALPSADRYYRSFMHRDTLSHLSVTPTNFLLTASVDGHLKFWKKKTRTEAAAGEPGIEFVKHYRAHLAPILALATSVDGLFAATLAADGASSGDQDAQGTVKVFDVENFDMINMITLPYVPRAACWIHSRSAAQTLLAISEQDKPVVRLYDGRGDGKPLATIDAVHRAPVLLLAYNEPYDCVVSADESGMVEYWSPREPFALPDDIAGLWQFKTATDLYEFKKHKSLPASLTFNPQFTHFVTTSLGTDRQIRIFNFLTGKIHRKYDESLTAIQEMQQAASKPVNGSHSGVKLDDMEFGRRLANERELEKSDSAAREKAVWDESGTFVLYPTLLGIKVVNTVSNRVVRILGKDENHRFLNLSLFQGTAEKKRLTTVAMAASDNPLLNKTIENDPILFCTAFKRSRFYLFSKDEPETDGNHKGFDRDVFNEKPTREEQSLAAIQPAPSKGVRTASFAIMHTDKGDIHLRLFPEAAPKTVENFVVHSKNGYYDGLKFHRVIKKFMIQTGDPFGDGTGGESIWGDTFEDEFSPSAKHDRPYTLSMANAGPKTNGSQFFITTVPTPWLDNKHTVFGRAVSGFDTIHTIENVKTSGDRPHEEIKILSITIN